MNEHDDLVAALVRALETDSSQQALQRAIAAVRVARGVSPSRAYAILVRASAGCPEGVTAPRLVPAQREPLLAGRVRHALWWAIRV